MSKKNQNMSIVEIQKEINKELANKEVFSALVNTTFKGLNQNLIKRAIMEGVMRGFDFKDFLEKSVYAIPFKDTYTLVISIDYARKIGMRSGIVGKSVPIFEEKDGKIVSCTLTVKRQVNGYVGDYTTTVYFDEYYKPGKAGYPSLWDTKPHTMIAKVAEMHALRMACPEELAQKYGEEEMEREIKTVEEVKIDADEYRINLESAGNMEELKTIWSSIPPEAKEQLKSIKDEIKKKYENK